MKSILFLGYQRRFKWLTERPRCSSHFLHKTLLPLPDLFQQWHYIQQWHFKKICFSISKYCCLTASSLRRHNRTEIFQINITKWRQNMSLCFTSLAIYLCIEECWSPKEPWPFCTRKHILIALLMNANSRDHPLDNKNYSLAVITQMFWAEKFGPKKVQVFLVKDSNIRT